ncbi:hypothetical protein CK203_105928 [Vitis vinifera]|uniref:Uncharacterized protein n=1 Tax=Vitis vinifera TaxID=29760 RepID=A0A438E6J5_VITVI|nr:hypothetical protein CK203_105928 [Vitis vinifera]
MGYLLLVYLKRWNKEPFGNVSVRKERLSSWISFWDAKGRENTLSSLRVIFEVLEELEARRLEGVFSEEEVLGALLELNGDKAPGLFEAKYDLSGVDSKRKGLMSSRILG